MFSKLLIFISLVTFSLSGMAQTLVRFQGENARTMSSLSENGKFSAGYAQDNGAWYYDLSQKKMTFFEAVENVSDYIISSISNDGIGVGVEYNNSAANGQNDYPAYFKDGVCTRLPLPGDGVNINGRATGISADGKIIVGVASPVSMINRKPCMWTLQEDGTYKIEMLPTYEKDLTGRTLQGVDPMRCSSDGSVIGGRYVDNSGMMGFFLKWTKNDKGEWTIKELGRYEVYKPGMTVPVLPEQPENPDATVYFSAAEWAAYNQALENYNNDPENYPNPAEHPEQFLTDPEDIAKFQAEVVEYDRLNGIFNEKWMDFIMNNLTGNGFDTGSFSMSVDGKYIGTSYTAPDPETVGDPEGGFITCPARIDTETGLVNAKTYIKSGIVNGILSNGDLFVATPYREVIRTSFVIPNGTDDMIDVAAWVKQQTNGKMDIAPEFTFEFGAVTDSLIVGDVIPSSNGRILLGTLESPKGEGTISYMIDMDEVYADIQGVKGDDAVSVYPNPATDVLYIKGNAESVSVVDLTGRTMYESSAVSGSVPVGMLGAGTYLVKIKADGKETTHKVFVR